MNPPTLYIFAGLPGSGKTALSQRLASNLHATHLRIDTIEQGLRDLCGVNVEGEGYQLSHRIATDNLKLGLSVVADSCNPWELTRRGWENVAKALKVDYINIEVICSDKVEHRRRVEIRPNTIPTLQQPTWQQVVSRDYHVWTVDRTVVETANRTKEEAFSAMLSALGLS